MICGIFIIASSSDTVPDAAIAAEAAALAPLRSSLPATIITSSAPFSATILRTCCSTVLTVGRTNCKSAYFCRSSAAAFRNTGNRRLTSLWREPGKIRTIRLSGEIPDLRQNSSAAVSGTVFSITGCPTKSDGR